VALAARHEFVEHLRMLLGDDEIDVVERSDVEPFDLVYRPYQLIDPTELPWLRAAGRRLLLGQLDMIGFSNPSYHPSSGLFHSVRNLQRRTLRLADGVTFISEFGRDVTLAECPDLDSRRLFVVSCGSESEPIVRVAAGPLVDGEFVLCLSASFSHKNRQHALQVFERLSAEHGYPGALVIAGPEPFYGRSTEDERGLLAAMPGDVSARVHFAGQIDEAEKWDLLRRAQLVLYPSVVEGFGLVPFEAAAVGTPTLAFAGSGLGELLGGTPCLVKTWNVREWAERAAALLASDREASDAIVAINDSAARHTWEDVATKTWEAVDCTVASPRRRPQVEEGGWVSRVAPIDTPVGMGTRSMHFAQRGFAFLRRRLRPRA
jgi:glycosyltransferase involved in cell wall biosynthesis